MNIRPARYDRHDLTITLNLYVVELHQLADALAALGFEDEANEIRDYCLRNPT